MNSHLPTEKQQKLKQLIVIFSILLITLLFVFTFLIARPTQELSSFDLDQQGQKVGSGPTEFRIYNQQVYVAVPSNGHYVIPEADLKTIRMLSDDIATRQIAVDQKHVYCGNIILKNLNPQTVRSIGDGYISDGQVSYYCSQITERNTELNVVKEVWQILLHHTGTGSKPQSYWYPHYQLESSQSPYQLTVQGTVSNGEYTYFRGKLVEQANGQTMRYLPSYSGGSDRLRESSYYTADGTHVYYKNKRVPVQDQSQLMVFDFGGGIESEFLHDPKIQNFYYQTFPFSQKYSPYYLLNKDDEHAHDPLFLSRQGIYFYHRKAQKLKRLGDNPFSQKLTQLAPDVFHNGQDTYYLGLYDKYIRSGRGTKLCYRSTVLYRLKNAPVNRWQKIAEVKYGDGRWRAATIWKNGVQYYYFDEFGQGQGFDQAVYLIKDAYALRFILNPSRSSDDIRQYAGRGILLSPQVERLAKAKYDENFCVSEIWSKNE